MPRPSERQSPLLSGAFPWQSRYTKLVFRKGSNIKFKNLVAPNEEPEFVFTKTQMADGSLSTSVSVERGETQFVKMSLQFSVAD